MTTFCRAVGLTCADSEKKPRRLTAFYRELGQTAVDNVKFCREIGRTTVDRIK